MVQSTLKQQLHDAELEVKEQAEKHKEILQYSQSLAENNASSKASVAELQAKVCVQMMCGSRRSTAKLPRECKIVIVLLPFTRNRALLCVCCAVLLGLLSVNTSRFYAGGIDSV